MSSGVNSADENTQGLSTACIGSLRSPTRSAREQRYFTGITRAEEKINSSTIVGRLAKLLRSMFMATDPVCGMKVDDKNQQHQTQYNGETYSFCSQQCKNEFEQSPEQYVEPAA